MVSILSQCLICTNDNDIGVAISYFMPLFGTSAVAPQSLILETETNKNYEDHWMPPIVRLLAYKHSLYLVAEARVNGIAMHLKLGDFFLPYFVSDLEKTKGSVVSQKWSIYLARLKIFSIMSLLIKNGFYCYWNFATASFAHISMQQKVWPNLQEVSLFHNVETYQL